MPNNKDMDNNLEMDLYHGRPDYYPYNQEWLDEYFEKYSEENSWRADFSRGSQHTYKCAVGIFWFLEKSNL